MDDGRGHSLVVTRLWSVTEPARVPLQCPRGAVPRHPSTSVKSRLCPRLIYQRAGRVIVAVYGNPAGMIASARDRIPEQG